MAEASDASPIATWFVDGSEPALRGLRCTQCGNVVFPPRAHACPNPACFGTELEPVTLSRRGRLWSFTDSQYAPPPPYPSGGDAYEPFALAAVELDAEKIVVLGQVIRGLGIDDLTVGMEMELAVEPLPDGTAVWKWRPAGSQAPRTGAPAGSQAPRAGKPIGSQAPRTGAPAGSQAPRTGAPAGSQAPRAGKPIGSQPAGAKEDGR